MTEHKRLTTKEKYPHGAEGVSKDKLTGKYCRGVFEATACVEKLAEYETAEEEGRLVVLPCKVGDTVWTFYDDMSGVVDFTVEKIQIEFDKNGKPYFLIDGMDFEEDCLGRTLFFDREEAEKALKEMEGKS